MINLLPPKARGADIDSGNLRIEFVPGATTQALLLHQVSRALARPIGGQLEWFPGDLPPLGWVDWFGVFLPPTRGTKVARVELEKYPAEWVTAPGAEDADRVILYFHGGGLRTCGLRTYRRLGSRLSAAAHARVLNAGYRLLPSVTLSEQRADALAAYRFLLDSGVSPENIVVAGDSGGAQMALWAAIGARDAGLPTPAGIIAISPWVDFDFSAKRAHPNFQTDPLLSPRLADLVDRWVRTGIMDTTLGAINADLTGMPPVLIQAGSTEVLCADAELLAERLAAAGVRTHFQVWDRQFHVFHIGADVIPEARAAIEEIGAFAKRTTDRTQHQERRRT